MKHPIALALAIALSGSMAACTDAGSGKSESATAQAQTDAVAADAGNPFFSESPLPLHYPQFDKIKDERLRARLRPRHGRAAARKSQAIANNAEAPTFDNTIVAMEKSGPAAQPRLDRVLQPGRREHQRHAQGARRPSTRRSWPRTATRSTLNAKLFARIKALYDKRDSLGLDAESDAPARALPHRLRARRRQAVRRRQGKAEGDQRRAGDAAARRSARTC